jgi:hypothetical protein
VREYIHEYQGHMWAVLSHYSAARYDQLQSMQKAFQCVNHQPWNKVLVISYLLCILNCLAAVTVLLYSTVSRMALHY